MSKVKITETAQRVLEERYFIKGETKWSDLCIRVGNFFGKTSEETASFTRTMNEMDFLPNSPVLMNAGTAIKAYSACYVLPVEDSIESIYKFYKDAAIISKSGGGVGANYSSIRGKDSLVNSTDGVASGPLSFMEVQDVSTDIIKQGGRRRGANMGILVCDHEDINEFIRAKDVPGSLENFNLSVGITDEFMSLTKMRGAGGGAQYKLWNELIQRAWSSAEPGVLFMDTIEAGNTVPHLGKLEATNPCGEQPLLPYESCTLGSINLSNMVILCDLLEDGSYTVDWAKLKETTHTAVLFLNRILDKSEMPIPECQDAMERTRKIGLGIMGLHDMLIQLGVAYDSEEGRSIAGEVMEYITQEANTYSRELGDSEGVYIGARLPADKDGIYWENDCPQRRNACLTTIAPTGTLSMIADCSSGCEPYYAPVTYKTVLDGTTFAMPNKWVATTMEDECVEDYKWLSSSSKDLFKGAEEIHWRDHVLMQATLQEWVDSSISKTINMPNSATKEDVRGAYELAYETGCKGITIYRDGSRGEQVLSTSSSEGPQAGDNRVDKESEEIEDGQRVHTVPGVSQGKPIKADLEDVLSAKRYRVRINDQSVYIIIAEEPSGAPCEIFVKFPYQSTDNCYTPLCRSLSLSMRYGVPLTEIVKQLEKSVVVVNDAPSHLARILKMYMQSKGTSLEKVSCPGCGEGTLIFSEGCEKCGNCGWSKCG